MARRGDIEIPIAVDTGGIEKSVQNGLVDPIEDAEKALEKLGKVDAGKDLERDLEKAQDATEDLDDELERARKGLDKLGFAARDAGADGKAGLNKIGDGAQEVQREIGTNLGEAVSSIRGDFSDLSQVGQDTLGGLAATLAGTGPAGIVGAVGLAGAAVGWGLITANIQEQQEKADDLRNKLTAAYTEAQTAGEKYLSTAYIVNDALDVQTNPERAEEWKELQRTQKETGLEMSTILKANAGDLRAVREVQSRVNALVDEEVEKREKSGGGNISRDLQDVEDYWRMVGDESTKANEKSQAAIKNTSDFLLEEVRSAKKVQVEVDEIGNKLVTLDDGTEVFIDVETGTAYSETDRFKGDFDKKVKTMNGSEVRVKARADTELFDRRMKEIANGSYNVTLGIQPRVGKAVPI